VRRSVIYASLVVIAAAAATTFWIGRRPMVVERASLGTPPRQISRPKSLIGQVAPSFTGADQSGREISTSRLRGRVVVVNVWASWCRPCVEEMPRLEAEIWRRFQPQLVVVGIALGEEPAKVKDFSRQSSLTFPLVADPKRKIARRFGAGNSIPQTFVISRSGVIVYQTLGYDRQTFDHMVSAAERALARH
jgi:peroxiredoxin